MVPEAERLPDGHEVLASEALPSTRDDLTVACYTFPHYHRSAVNDHLYGKGWTEYVLARSGRPWFPGHDQPRMPLLGELDERCPATWERYNRLANSHGIDVWIWDMYWYGGGPVLHEALDEGFLRSGNKDLTRFAVMWTNHPWTVVFPTAHPDGSSSWPPAFDAPDNSPEDVWRSTTYLIARYFHDPLYWSIDGRPVFCMWDASRLIGLLGASGTKELLEGLRGYAARLGHDGIHFHVCFQPEIYGQLADLGFDSYGFYQPIAQAAGRRPRSEDLPDYANVASDVVTNLWPEADALSPLPFFPSVSPGWDTTPRYRAPATNPCGDRESWPGVSFWGDPLLVTKDTPAAFGAFVKAARVYLNERGTSPRVLTISCWNEWTEGHYLLPDTRFGYGMLEALADALGVTSERP